LEVLLLLQKFISDYNLLQAMMKYGVTGSMLAAAASPMLVESIGQALGARTLGNISVEAGSPSIGAIGFKYATGPSLIFGVWSFGVQKSLERGMRNLEGKGRADSCINCTKKY
jgi:hypothetical protein